jgi:murein DD-endopeptidase MepM/ murein hydrolase activator NlpD
MVRTTLIGLLITGVMPIAFAEATVLTNKQPVILTPQPLPNTIGSSIFCNLSNFSTVCPSSTFFYQSEVISTHWLQTAANILLSGSKFSGCLEQFSPSQLSSQGTLVPSSEKAARLGIPVDQNDLKPTATLNQFPNLDSISSSRDTSTSTPQGCILSWQPRLNQKIAATSKLVANDKNVSKSSSSSSAVAPLTQFPKLSRSSLIIPFPQEDSSFSPSNTKLANPAPETKRIGSTFGWRIRPYSNQLQFHEGIDYGAPLGSPVVAVDDGIVTKVVSGCIDFGDLYCGGQLGNWVEIDHGDGAIATYGHLKNSSITVKEGMKVWKNQEIAQVGSSGWSTGAHLDFRIQVNGKQKDPAKFLAFPQDF